MMLLMPRRRSMACAASACGKHTNEIGPKRATLSTAQRMRSAISEFADSAAFRDFINFSGRGQTDSAVVGGPKELADYMEEMFVNHGCDGFVVAATHVQGAYADFVRHVIPEVQRRGLFHKDYTGATLRENLGLPRPPVGAWKLAKKVAAE